MSTAISSIIVAANHHQPNNVRQHLGTGLSEYTIVLVMLLKRLLVSQCTRVPIFFADICNHLLLKHQVALIQSRYLKRLFSLQNNIIRQNSSYIKSGYFVVRSVISLKIPMILIYGSKSWI